MKNLIKICLLSLFIFALGIVGINIPNREQKQYNLNISSDIAISAKSTPPSSYDLRNFINIEVEDQNPYGICYAFASLTSLETYLALNYGEYYDFSEVHFALSLYKQAGYYNSVAETLNDGGNFTHFIT